MKIVHQFRANITKVETVKISHHDVTDVKLCAINQHDGSRAHCHHDDFFFPVTETRTGPVIRSDLFLALLEQDQDW